MTSTEKIGGISNWSGKAGIAWEINDFFSYTEGRARYLSPDFHVLNSVWQISIRPIGLANDRSSGHVSLYLHKVDNGASKPVDFEFGIKTANYLIANKIKTKTPWICNKKGWGFSKFIAVSELQRKQNLVPSGSLTIICTLTERDEKPFDADTSNNKLVADLKNMFVSKKNTDVIIKVQYETFSAHSNILAARSPVLSAMFENDMTEKKTGVIDICDCDPKEFSHFLFYLYSGKIESVNCDFFHLFKIADKYDVPELKFMCIDFIIHDISLENFCETYLFGYQFDEGKILTKVQTFFNENFEEVVFSESWELFLVENPRLTNSLLKAMATKVKIE